MKIFCFHISEAFPTLRGSVLRQKRTLHVASYHDVIQASLSSRIGSSTYIELLLCSSQRRVKSFAADWHKSIQMYVNPNDGLCKSWTEYKFSFMHKKPRVLFMNILRWTAYGTNISPFVRYRGERDGIKEANAIFANTQ